MSLTDLLLETSFILNDPLSIYFANRLNLYKHRNHNATCSLCSPSPPISHSLKPPCSPPASSKVSQAACWRSAGPALSSGRKKIVHLQRGTGQRLREHSSDQTGRRIMVLLLSTLKTLKLCLLQVQEKDALHHRQSQTYQHHGILKPGYCS